MNLSAQIAAHLRQVYFGGNWTDVNLKETLADVTQEEATAKVYHLNTIATLVYHTQFYIRTVQKVLDGEALSGRDADSFQHPPLASAEEWERLKNSVWTEVERFASSVEALPEEQLSQTFMAEKYGNWYRNLQGITEHLHYHLGQIVLIKKILRSGANHSN